MTLERTYRRLLAAYPWEHRREYEEEMLGVLLDDAGARRWPRLRDVLDLLGGAVRARARHLAVNLADPRWAEAAAAMGLIVALAMLAYAVRPMALPGEWTTGAVDPSTLLHWHSWARIAAWAAVAVAAAVGLRRTAAVIAWAAMALEVVRAVHDTLSSGSGAVGGYWTVALALTGAAALTVPAPRSGVDILGRRRVVLLAGIVAIGTSAPAVITSWPPRTVAPLVAVFLGLGIMCVLTLAAALRRRILALLAPAGVTLLMTGVGFDLMFGGSPAYFELVSQDDGTTLMFIESYGVLSLAQLLTVVATPLLTFAVAVAVVHRRERTLRLLGLGRAADRVTPAE